MEPIKPFTFMVLSAIFGLFPFTILFFVIWIVALISSASKS